MPRYFHGTSADNLASIIEEGLRPGICPNWTVSGGYVYFWSSEALKEAEGLDDDKQAEECAKVRAAESAEFCLARAKDCRRIVIEVDLDGLQGQMVEPDESCQNMDGAVRIKGSLPPERIKRIWIDEESFAPIQGYFIAMRVNDRALATPFDYTDFEAKLAKAFESIEIAGYLFEFTHEKIDSMIEVPHF